MSFSYDTKNELCRLPVQKLCCARAEAYGILLFCNTFSATEVRIITENPHFAARLPKLFRRAFNLQFDRQPEQEQEEGKRIFQITDQKKLDHIINLLGFDPQQNLVLHINFGMVEETCDRAAFLRGAFFAGGQYYGPPKALPSGTDYLPFAGEPGVKFVASGVRLSAQKSQPGRQPHYLFQAERPDRGLSDADRRARGSHERDVRQAGKGPAE